MKITIYSLFIFLFSITIAQGQVTSVDYRLKYNQETELFEGRLLINAGSATTYPQRIQFNAQFSVVVPTGSSVELVESFMPLQNNQDYTGTIPLEWEIGLSTTNPSQSPGNDFYSIIPNLAPTAAYNNLTVGDEIHLFNLAVSGDNVCDKNVRIFDNELDPGSIGSNSYVNGFTLGGINQIYSGNSNYPSTSDWDIELVDVSICEGECITLTPNLYCASFPLEYTWSNGNMGRTIVVCPAETTSYSVTITGPDGYADTFENTVSVESIADPIISGSEIICISGTTQLLPDNGVLWVSNNPSVATVTVDGLVTGVAEGDVTFVYTDATTGCSSIPSDPISVVPPPTVLSSASSIEVGDFAFIVSETPGTWENLSPDIISYEFPDKIQGLSVGIGTLLFTDDLTDCEVVLEIMVTQDISNVQGVVFRDTNNNTILDSGSDSPLPNCSVSIPSINAVYFTNEDGFFDIELSEDTYDFEFLVQYGNWDVNPLTREIEVNSDTEYLFAPFHPQGEITDGTIVVGSSILQCNAVVNLDISVFNNGNQTLDGYLVIDIDDRSSVDSSDPFPVGSNDNELTWEVSELLPGYTFAPEILIDVPNTEVDDDSLFFSGYLLTLNGDTLKSFDYADVITCEGFPGTMRSWPDRAGEDNITFRSENLDYTVRFQNPTTDTSYSCVITAKLDENIDPLSFKLKNSSQKVVTRIVNDTLILEFEDFVLPPESDDFSASQAFVSFEFEFYEDIEEGTQIFNQATIRHGETFSLTTEEVLNTVVSDISVNTNDINTSAVELYPNPVSDYLYIDSDQQISKIHLHSKLGRFISTFSIKNNSVDVSAIPSGLYLVHIEFENGNSEIQKLVIN